MSSDDARADVPEEHDGVSGDAGDTDAATVSRAEPQEPEPNVFARQPVFLVASVLVAVGLIAAVTFGILWWVKSSSDAAQNAEARDEVVAAAEEAITAFAEVDYENPDKYRNQQVAVSTEELAQHVKDGWKQARQVIVKAQRSSEITFFDVAVEELNAYDGTATAIASSEVTLSFEDQSAQLPRRWRAQLERVEGEWKLSDIELVPLPRTQQVGNQGSEPQ
ncbi:hypothetical protein [Haloechinothrix salitolerans]|uniref:Mce-associated membrane protein n=1 Tax=Haloechinothrix salitolerans TaxID=926830 RepID=A0ABW2C7P3_9PSEU